MNIVHNTSSVGTQEWLISPSSSSLSSSIIKNWRNKLLQHIDVRLEVNKLRVPLFHEIWPLCSSLRSLTINRNIVFDLHLLHNHPTLERVNICNTSFERGDNNHLKTPKTKGMLPATVFIPTTPIMISSQMISLCLSYKEISPKKKKGQFSIEHLIELDVTNAVKLQRMILIGSRWQVNGATHATSLTNITIDNEHQNQNEDGMKKLKKMKSEPKQMSNDIIIIASSCKVLIESKSITHVTLGTFDEHFVNMVTNNNVNNSTISNSVSSSTLPLTMGSSASRWLHLDVKTSIVCGKLI
jgi:hypothetical protein